MKILVLDEKNRIQIPGGLVHQDGGTIVEALWENKPDVLVIADSIPTKTLSIVFGKKLPKLQMVFVVCDKYYKAHIMEKLVSADKIMPITYAKLQEILERGIYLDFESSEELWD